ncbi:TauD/TfdA family dioxygenase [Vibrio metschnikovii]|uniref:TauD/TfdA family dioxygenase n=1 Tax=Vibrio metschnikovii TaxID=28172 RepID=UPI0020C700CC|nr:TauD/TfdA family dioxygenase [Vibrio metschnikovii]
MFKKYISHMSLQRSLKKLKEAFSHLRMGNDEEWLNVKEWLGNITKHYLNDEIVNIIGGFKLNDNQCALIIRGLPIDTNLCATPYSGYIPPSKISLATALNIGIYQLANVEPVSYQNENEGFLFRHVVPAKNALNERSSHGSIHTFGHHVDNPDLPLACEKVSEKSGCPEFLSLMALRSDLKVRSNFILVDDLVKQLSGGVIKELCEPNFRINRPDSFGQSCSSILPILVTRKDGVIFCRYDKENTTPLTERAAAALVMLEAQLNNELLKQYVVYQPGDLLIIKNQRVVHSREGFQARCDGADRWLVRLFGMSSLDRIVPVASELRHIGKD